MSETAKRLRCIGAMSAAVESNRQLVLHFKRPVEDEDRAAVLAAINAAIARPAGDEGCREAQIEEAAQAIYIAKMNFNGWLPDEWIPWHQLEEKHKKKFRLYARAALSARGEQAGWQPIAKLPGQEPEGVSDWIGGERWFLTYHDRSGTYDTAYITRDLNGRYDFSGFTLGVSHWRELLGEPPAVSADVQATVAGHPVDYSPVSHDAIAAPAECDAEASKGDWKPVNRRDQASTGGTKP